MTKKEAKKKILGYFKENSIPYRFLNEESKLIILDFSDTVYLNVEIPEVIGGYIETCLRFLGEGLFAQSYYCQPVIHSEEIEVKAARIIAYLNQHLNYTCNSLYPHIFGLDDEGGDILNRCYIRYELLERYFYESMNHILNFSVQQLVDVCLPVMSYLAGKSTYFEATKIGIDHKLMGNPVEAQ